MKFTMNLQGQVKQLRLATSKACWPLFEAIVNALQSLEETPDCKNPQITVRAYRNDNSQQTLDGQLEQEKFNKFKIVDNGEGFSERNYASFLEAYSTLKATKGCKGIGRFLWLKAFDKVHIKSIYKENNVWKKREFDFSLADAVSPENNCTVINESPHIRNETTIELLGFKKNYRSATPSSLEALAKKIIEHCLPYFIIGNCPDITLIDNLGKKYDLKPYYEKKYKGALKKDEFQIKKHAFALYHMAVKTGIDKNEIHLCANNREVLTIDLGKNLMPSLNKKINGKDGSYYYQGYLTSNHLDAIVNEDRTDFNFDDDSLFDTVKLEEINQAVIPYIEGYLGDDLIKIKEVHKNQVDSFVQNCKPQYRYLLNRKKETYDLIPPGLPPEKLDLALYKNQQQWEMEIAEQGAEITQQKMDGYASPEDFKNKFNMYCRNLTELNQASLTSYVLHRKVILDFFERALEINDSGKFSKESIIHSIICPMQTTSDQIPFDNMNLWIIDDRLAYHHFLSSDQAMNKVSTLQNGSSDRMDLAIFNTPFSYAEDINNINSTTIIELKRPMRDDLHDEESPIAQVLRYVKDIRSGKIKKKNGRSFGPVDNVAFYCYIIADLTDTLKESATLSNLSPTPDGKGYFGYNAVLKAYIEIISYDKLIGDAKKRNQIFFDKLFHPLSQETGLSNLAKQTD